MKIPSFRTKEKRLRFNRAYMCVCTYIYIYLYVYTRVFVNVNTFSAGRRVNVILDHTRIKRHRGEAAALRKSARGLMSVYRSMIGSIALYARR